MRSWASQGSKAALQTKFQGVNCCKVKCEYDAFCENLTFWKSKKCLGQDLSDWVNLNYSQMESWRGGSMAFSRCQWAKNSVKLTNWMAWLEGFWNQNCVKDKKFRESEDFEKHENSRN